MCITPQTKNLFQRAIIMSGSSFNKTWSLVPRINQAERLAKSLGWKGQHKDEKAILDFLENIPAFELDDASKKLLTDEEQFGEHMLVPFGPMIEPYDSDNCIFSKEPIEMARETWTNEIDLIVMGCSFEGILRAFIEEEKVVKFLQNPSYFAPLLELRLKASDENARMIGTKIKNLFYDDGEEVTVENIEKYLKVSFIALFLYL
jgi:carboxylesterase type B